MTILNIRGHSVQIDIESELREYGFGHNARWTPDKLIASSPFRDDNTPSFFVNLTGEYAGTWADSGSIDEQYSRGNFVALIAHLRGESYEEAGDYLLEKYGTLYEIKPDEPIRLARPKLRKGRRRILTIDNPIKQAVSPYLVRRGICPRVQELYGVGYDEEHFGFTAFPLRTETGKVANVLYRSTRGKRFFYAREGTPKNRLLFGADIADEIAILNEGIIDALSWETLGYSALAVGGASISSDQIEIIKRSRIKRLYLGGDNDEQGRNLNARAAEALRGYVELYTIDYGKEKDANDALLRQGIQYMHDIYERAEPIRAIDPIRLRA